MKIAPILDTVRFTDRVQEKKDGHDRRDSQHQNPEKKKDDEHAEDVSPENIERAMNEFSNDPLAVAQGLSVSKSGQGPGLKVVLKDGQGGVLRQFTGEEFLRLREAASAKSPRGKLLDRKA